MGPRILVAELYHETHTFVQGTTDLRQFRIHRGVDIPRRRGDGSVIDGFLEVAERERWEVVPSVCYSATPSELVRHEVFEAFWTELQDCLHRQSGKRLDGIFIALHGAMVTSQSFDPEGELLARIRAVESSAEVPIFGVFDLHASFSDEMACRANGLVAYRENPHTDARDSAIRAASLLARALRAGQRPQMRVLRLPILWPPGGTATADSPMRDLATAARHIERDNPELWAVNVVAGFPYADVPDCGVSVSAITTGSAETADRLLAPLGELAAALKHHGLRVPEGIGSVLDKVEPSSAGPVVIVEPADNIGGGAPGDATAVLGAFIERGLRNAAIAMTDPQAVRLLGDVEIGATREIDIGGWSGPLAGPTLRLTARLVSRSDGRFTIEDPRSHLAAMGGSIVDMGPSAVVRCGGVTILLTTLPTPPFDLAQWKSQGIDPAKLSFIGVKAAVAHRRAYDPIQAASFTVETLGPCPTDLTRLPYRHVRRPIFPLDLPPAR